MVMIEQDNSCKGCRDEYVVTEEQIARILSATMFKEGEAVPDEVYAFRLSQCEGCPKLLQGHTCTLCGCIVKVSAKFSSKSCPLPGAPLWGKYTG